MSDEIGVKIKATTEGVSDAAQQVKSLGEGAESIVENFKGLAAALGAAFSVDAAHEFLKSMEETAEQLERLKNITGLSTSTLQDMQNQMRLTGGDSETAAQGMVRFERSVYDAAAGSGPAFEAFKKLGVSWDDLKHNSIEDILEKTKQGLQGLADDSERNAIGVALFSRGYINMAAALTMTKDKAQELDAAFVASGAKMSTEMIAKLEETSVQAKELGNDLRGLGITILSQVIDPAHSLTTEIGGVIQSFRNWIIETDAVEKAVLTFDLALNGLKSIITGVETALANIGVIGNAVFESIRERSIKPLDDAIQAAEANTKKWLQDNLSAADQLNQKLAEVAAKVQGESGAAPKIPDRSDASGTVGGRGRNPEGQDKTAEANKPPPLDLSESRSGLAEQYDVKKEYDALMVESGQMSHKQEYADLQSQLNLQQTLTDASFDQQEAEDGLTVQQYQNLIEKKSIADQKFAIEHMKLTQEQTKEDTKDWTSALNTIDKSFDQMLTGVLQGTQTIGGAFERMAGDMVISFIEAIAKMLVQWAAFQAATATGFGAGLTNPFSGNGGGFFGAAVGGIGSLLSFDTGTNYVPDDMVANIHKGEIIIPAGASQQIREGTASVGGGGATSVHFNVSAMDAKGVKAFFNQHGATIMSALSNQVRSGNRSFAQHA